MPYSDISEKYDKDYLVSTFKYKDLKPDEYEQPEIDEYQGYWTFLKEWICSIFK